jgi:hypothetical protein
MQIEWGRGRVVSLQDLTFRRTRAGESKTGPGLRKSPNERSGAKSQHTTRSKPAEGLLATVKPKSD